MANGPVSSPQFINGTPDWVKPIIEKASEQYNIPTILLSSLIKQESGFRTDAQSPVGAQGIAQFMPETAKTFGIDPFDPNQAVNAAAKYLRSEWDYFGKPELALAAYNAGRGAVQQYGNKIPPYKETQNYVKNIMAMAGEPHASANQPLLDMVNEAKKASKAMNPFNPPSASATQGNVPRGGMMSSPGPMMSTPQNMSTPNPGYTVKQGDSLSGILKAQGNPNWASPNEWAKIKVPSGNPALIRPGEVLKI